MLKKLFIPLIIALGFSFTTQAAVTPDSAKNLVQDLANSAISAAKLNHDNFEKLFHKYFDSMYIGRFILGRYWKQATPAQQKEYLKLFNKLVVTSYEKRFDEYQGEQLKITDTNQAGRDVIVKSILMDPNKSPIHINWRVRERSKGPRIIDVVVEDISLSITQRSEFASIIQQNNNSIEALLNALREKLHEPADQQASFMGVNHTKQSPI